ncbi:MAG: TIGR04290 family methyltransferase [Candidatus Binataceae bacterium]|nr:TIGR04290 family methyltransferase [Candidatus Binataceae bacterium]
MTPIIASGKQFSRDEIQHHVNSLGRWFHNIDLCGVQTAPDHFLGDFPASKWKRFEHAIPQDLRGKAVLDIGCNGGFYSLEMKHRGASRVLGIDCDEDYLAQARFAAQVCGADIEFRRMSVYDIANIEERFDLVLFLGVLYHLRHPLLALDLIHEHVAGDTLIFQSMIRGADKVARVALDYPFDETGIFTLGGMPRMQFVEHGFAGDPTNWWIPNRACVEAMLRSSGFAIVGRPEDEVYVCRRLSEENKAVQS